MYDRIDLGFQGRTITIPALLRECNEDELAEHISYACRPEWFKRSTLDCSFVYYERI
jgi:hypothetical protein